jgi:hypothetical protein
MSNTDDASTIERLQAEIDRLVALNEILQAELQLWLDGDLKTDDAA